MFWDGEWIIFVSFRGAGKEEPSARKPGAVVEQDGATLSAL